MENHTTAHDMPNVPTVSDAMVDAYLKAQREAVEEADRFGRPNIGGLHTNTVRKACRAGLNAALDVASASRQRVPTYSELLRLAQRLAYPDAGELLILDDYRNIARNVIHPAG